MTKKSFTEPCIICDGSGKKPSWVSGDYMLCFYCEGTGKRSVDYENHCRPVCPNCGYQIKDYYEYFEIEDNEIRELECPKCEAMYNCKITVIHKFESKLIPKKKEDGNDED